MKSADSFALFMNLLIFPHERLRACGFRLARWPLFLLPLSNPLVLIYVYAIPSITWLRGNMVDYMQATCQQVKKAGGLIIRELSKISFRKIVRN